MQRLAGMLDRLVLLVGVFVAGLLPSFIQDYRQHLGGRLDQLSRDIGAWQAIADRHHQGSLQALIQHHRASGDASFIEEAAAIDSMLEQAGALREALAALQGDALQQTWGWLTHLDRTDAAATWALFQPSFPVNPEGLGFALIGGALLWLFWLGLVWSAARLFTRRHHSPPSPHPTAPAVTAAVSQRPPRGHKRS